jgi:predicted nuclease of restriction endonuclease-like RecB superfamily
LLTGDLLRVRKRGTKIVPRYLDARTRERLLPLARELVAIPKSMIGRSRDEVEAAIEAIPFVVQDRIVGLGLAKLVEDRTEYAIGEGIDPEAIRHEVFLAAAAAHKALDVRGALDRDAVLAAAAARLGLTVEAVESGLYADLRGAEVLKSFRPIGAEELVARYNVALAQAILLRATRVVVHLDRETPQGYRRIFRAARFHGLLHVVTREADGYTITLDGPFSLFESVQKYGLRLAMFLPSVLACRSYRVVAEVVWGKSRERRTFELSSEEDLSGTAPEEDVSPEIEAFCEGFRKLDSGWRVTTNERVFALPGEVACIPDLEFLRESTGERVYLETFGFWSRDAVWKRIELLRKGFPERVILAVGKQLRVSEQVLEEGDAGEVYVYRSALSPKAVLERLEKRS